MKYLLYALAVALVLTGCNKRNTKSGKSTQNAGPANDKKVTSSEPLDFKAATRKDQKNLRDIMMAMHNYSDQYLSLPPAVVYGPDRKPSHSWRVLLLPLLGQEELYNRYDLRKPWDSPENKKLLDQIPDVYRDPFRDAGSGRTRYAAVTGAEAGLCDHRDVVMEEYQGRRAIRPLLSGPGVRKLRDFRDGTSATCILGRMANEEGVAWTSPVDVRFEQALSGIDDARSFASGNFGFADGAIRRIHKQTSREALRSLLTFAGGDSVPADAVEEIKEEKSPNPSEPALPADASKNMRRLLIAMHDFHDAYGKFPPAVVYGPDGKPWHSWRVLILPMIGEAALAKEYDLSVPWNDARNQRVLSKMPKLFADAVGAAKPNHTRLVVSCGEGTAFPLHASGMAIDLSEGNAQIPNSKTNKGALSIREIKDGTAIRSSWV